MPAQPTVPVKIRREVLPATVMGDTFWMLIMCASVSHLCLYCYFIVSVIALMLDLI